MKIERTRISNNHRECHKLLSWGLKANIIKGNFKRKKNRTYPGNQKATIYDECNRNWRFIFTYIYCLLWCAVQIFRCAYRFMVIIIFQQVNQLPSTPYRSRTCVAVAFCFILCVHPHQYIKTEEENKISWRLLTITSVRVCERTVRQNRWHKVLHTKTIWYVPRVFLLLLFVSMWDGDRRTSYPKTIKYMRY